MILYLWPSNSAGHWDLIKYRVWAWVSHMATQMDKETYRRNWWGESRMGQRRSSISQSPTHWWECIYMFISFLWFPKDRVHCHITENIRPYSYILPLSPLDILLTLAKVPLTNTLTIFSLFSLRIGISRWLPSI